MNTRRLVGTLVSLALIGSVLTACGGGNDESAVCDDVDALRSSMNSLKSYDIREGEPLSDISGMLDQIRSDVRKLVDDASAEFEAEIDSVQSGTDDLVASVEAAVADPSAATLSTLADDVKGLSAAFKALQDAVADTC